VIFADSTVADQNNDNGLETLILQDIGGFAFIFHGPYANSGSVAKYGKNSLEADYIQKLAAETVTSTSSSLRTDKSPNDTGSSAFGLEKINGTNGDDKLVGSGAAEYISGGGGSDRIQGGGGDDYIDAGGGKDWSVFGGAGADTFAFGWGSGTIIVRDFQLGKDSVDLIGGLTADNLGVVHKASLGAVELQNGGSSLLRLYGDFNDRTTLDDLTSPSGGSSTSTTSGPATSAPTTSVSTSNKLVPSLLVSGTSGNDRIQGTNKAEHIKTGAGADSIKAGGGDDYIDAGAGNDWHVFGGAGADTFVFGRNSDTIVIRDFQDGIDSIALVDGLTKDNITLSYIDKLELVKVSTSGNDELKIYGDDYRGVTLDDFFVA